MVVHLQRHADRLHASVHHVRGRDDVCPGIGLVDRLVDEDRNRIVVEHIARLVEQAVLPVTCVGIERHVGQDPDIRATGVAYRLDRAAHQIVGIERLGAVVAAQFGLGVGKQRETRDTQIDRFLRAPRDVVDRPARYARQARHRFFHARPVGDEQRPDEIGGGEHGLAMHRAAPRGGARAAESGGGIAGLGHAAALPHADARCNLSPCAEQPACRSRVRVPRQRLRSRSARVRQAPPPARPS